MHLQPHGHGRSDRLPGSARRLARPQLRRQHDHERVLDTPHAACRLDDVQAPRRDSRVLDADAVVNGQMVAPRSATIYYRRKTLASLKTFPAGFKMIAGDRHATGRRVCRSRTGIAVRPARCPPRAPSRHARTTVARVCACTSTSRVAGTAERLDTADHVSHMAYAVRGTCPADHPVAVPAISLIFRYAITAAQASRSHRVASTPPTPISSTRGGRARSGRSWIDA